MKIFVLVLFAFILIGLVKLRLEVEYGEKVGFIVVLRVVFLKFLLYSNRAQDEKSSKTKKKNKIKKKEAEKKKKKKQKKKNLFQILEIVKVLIEPTFKFLKFLNEGFKITCFKVIVDVAEKDAYKTAINYARKTILINNVFFLVDSFCCVKRKEIKVKPNFLSNKTRAEIKINMKISVGRIVVGSLFYLVVVLNRLIKEGLLKK